MFVLGYFAALYLLAGGLVVWTMQTHRTQLNDVVVKACRIIPGFEDGFRNSVGNFEDPTMQSLRLVRVLLTWPALVAILFATIAIVRRFERTAQTGSILGTRESLEALRQDNITERCEQVEKVFAVKWSMPEVNAFRDFTERVWPVFGCHPGDGSISIRGALSSGQTFTADFEMHRQVMISSHDFFTIEVFVVMTFKFERVETDALAAWMEVIYTIEDLEAASADRMWHAMLTNDSFQDDEFAIGNKIFDDIEAALDRKGP